MLKYAVLATALVTTGTASAEVMKIEPGNWETTGNMTMTMNMAGQKNVMPMPVPKTTECVTEEKASFDPDQFADDTCQITNIKQTSSTLDFDVSCTENGMALNGKYNMTKSNDGKSVVGKVSMGGSQMGMNISMEGDIIAKHIGSCSAN